MSNTEPLPSTNLEIAADSSAVQVHIGILQDIVSRMANNSAGCKTWCITLVSAVLVVIADKAEAQYTWIALLPVVVFGLLDAYYLAQERAFRASYNQFVAKLHGGQATVQDLFRVAPLPGTSLAGAVLQTLSSFAIYPFYLTLLAMVAILRFMVA